jgi:cobalt-zinc-cadmium efflux system outer membrane protein
MRPAKTGGVHVLKLRLVMAVVMLSGALCAAEEAVELPAKLSLAQAEEILLRNNLTIIAARYGVDGARAASVIANYTPNPTLTVGAEQIDTNRRLNNYSSDTGGSANPTYTFRIDQMLETAHKKSLRTAAADFTLAANEAMVLDAIRQQTLQLKQFYYAALLAKENLKAANEILGSIGETEGLMTKLAKGGNIADIDLIKFQANKIQYESAVESAKVAYEQAVRDLANLLATNLAVEKSPDAPSKLELEGSLDAPKLELKLDELLAHADERPDVVAAQANLASAERTVCLNRAQRWADVTVGGEYQRVGADNTVGLVLSVPLPLYNNHKGNIQQAEALRDQATAQLKQARFQAHTDIDKAYQQFISNRKILALYESGVMEKAKQSLDIMRKSYENKNASLLDVLDAQRTYKQTLQAYNQSHSDLLNSLATLESATGAKLK